MKVPLITPIFNIFAEAGNVIYTEVLKLVWGLLVGVMQIIDKLQRAFFFLTGVEKITLSFNGKQVNGTMMKMEIQFQILNYINFRSLSEWSFLWVWGVPNSPPLRAVKSKGV